MTEFHRTKEWAAFSRKMRALITPQLPLPCVECGQPVYPDQAWDVSHVVAYATDPFQPLSPSAVGAGHRACNRKAGARLGRTRQLDRKREGQRLPAEGSGW